MEALKWFLIGVVVTLSLLTLLSIERRISHLEDFESYLQQHLRVN